VLLCLLCLQFACQADPRVDYTVKVDPARAPIVDVEAKLSGFGEDPVYLNIPLGYAYANVKTDHVENLVATGGDGKELEPVVVEGRIYGWPAAPAKVAYSVSMTHRAEVAEEAQKDGRNQATYEHPYVDDKHAFLIGSAVFMVPDLWDVRSSVVFQVPSGWRVLTPWSQKGDAYLPPSLTSLIDNYVALGHWDVRTVEVGGFKATLGFANGTPFGKDRLAEAFSRIIEAEMDVIGRPPPHDGYLFFFPDVGDMKGLGGSAKAESMVLALGEDMTEGDLPKVARLVAHEFFHLFAHGRQPAADDLRFFNEGFTEYYAYVACTRSHILTEAMLRRTIGQLLTRLRELPAGMTMREAQTRFFDDTDAATLCYVGGLLWALRLDAELRNASAGSRTLDALVRCFYTEAVPAITLVPEPYDYAAWHQAADEWWPSAPEGTFDMRLDDPLPWDLSGLLAPTGLDLGPCDRGLSPGVVDDAVFTRIFQGG
jgi:predicted metalloprotease with PDZ domain